MDYRISPGKPLIGTARVDGDKSISHRSIMLGSLADGATRITRILEGEDVLATIDAFRAMGVEIVRDDQGYLVHGVGIDGLKQPKKMLDMGNSGTAFRLMTGILAGQPWSVTLGGDASLSSRPMGRIIRPLAEMGARFESVEEKPPVTVTGAQSLKGLRYEMPVASAQVKSALLFAGLYADGKTEVREPAPTRDHTERMLSGFGYVVNRHGAANEWVSLEGGGRLKSTEIEVPADLSSATFFILGALISKNSELLLPGVGVNPSRDGVIGIFQRMGGDISILNRREVGGEPVADLLIKSSKLHGVSLSHDDIALAVDEIPSVAVAAACAEGVTDISGAEELRVKESDRIATTVAGLKALGASVSEKQDGMVITGGNLEGGRVESHGDHRIAMAFAVAGNVCSSQVQIADVECVATSFPGFYDLYSYVGLDISIS
ncbi:MAG: 3-phosphoshikimate 1-carboxyvinyltransferase [Acidiferrobacterales bacterium]|nr:3-phosphoshikimate 1-carboxyvinyltransferase [Acidiferrobacterales bacterium]